MKDEGGQGRLDAFLPAAARGLNSVNIPAENKCQRMREAAGEALPQAKYEREPRISTDVFSGIPASK